MGTIKQGILGGFSGKVGTVVGASWKGICTMRGLAPHVKNPRTREQLAQRSKFAMTLAVMQSMINFVRVGFKNVADKQTEFNAAMAYNIQNAIDGSYPDFNINYTNLMVSRGKLPMASNATVDAATGTVTFEWDDNSDEEGADARDIALCLCYDKDANESFAVTTAGTGTRGTLPTQVINIPARAVGHKLECYLAFMREDGKSNSDSIYVGEVTAQ